MSERPQIADKEEPDDDSPDRPATVKDIADMQAQIALVAMDPNLTIITHHGFI